MKKRFFLLACSFVFSIAHAADTDIGKSPESISYSEAKEAVIYSVGQRTAFKTQYVRSAKHTTLSSRSYLAQQFAQNELEALAALVEKKGKELQESGKLSNSDLVDIGQLYIGLKRSAVFGQEYNGHAILSSLFLKKIENPKVMSLLTSIQTRLTKLIALQLGSSFPGTVSSANELLAIVIPTEEWIGDLAAKSLLALVFSEKMDKPLLHNGSPGLLAKKTFEETVKDLVSQNEMTREILKNARQQYLESTNRYDTAGNQIRTQYAVAEKVAERVFYEILIADPTRKDAINDRLWALSVIKYRMKSINDPKLRKEIFTLIYESGKKQKSVASSALSVYLQFSERTPEEIRKTTAAARKAGLLDDVKMAWTRAVLDNPELAQVFIEELEAYPGDKNIKEMVRVVLTRLSKSNYPPALAEKIIETIAACRLLEF